ncbi:unnamed protein product [Adineta ricciae]|uniref:Uncharacterized protein n=2 Tax=Adineta ricciae TaxID=249248 RepID=A0A815QTE7_ADIRI|nr:unnamed protein product [Adineta ricciae]
MPFLGRRHRRTHLRNGRYFTHRNIIIESALNIAKAMNKPVSASITGGWNIATLDSTELYDPSTDNWTTANSMSIARYQHTATMLSNGKVLVTGGAYTSVVYLNTAEVYDPFTGNWTTANSMSIARYQHTATMLSNGKVLITGGWNDGGSVNGAEIYDPSTDSWTPANNMSISRYQHTATMLSSGKVLVTGGQNGGYLTSAESYE